MRAIVDGMQLAWTLGIRRIRVQSDSMASIAIFANASALDHQYAALVMQFQGAMHRRWEVHHSHIYRETNYATFSLMVCIFLIHRSGACPTDYIMIL
ncbi:hypothetical protein LINGRAHAP2_LOCUS27751 [Linum grandiflorum]